MYLFCAEQTIKELTLTALQGFCSVVFCLCLFTLANK